MWRPRTAWLSLTPEPESELPAAIATLRSTGIPATRAVERERARAQRLIASGSRRRWNRWIADARAVAETAPGTDTADGSVGKARAVALDVISNHDALKLGLAERAGRGGRGGRGR